MEYDWYKNSLFIPELNRVVEWFFSFMATPEFTGA
jgi:membrane protein required for colicin V production